MSTFYDDAPKMPGIRGDYAKVAYIYDADCQRVLIRAVDTMAVEYVSLAFSPDQARDLAQALIKAADQADGSAREATQ